MRWFYYTFLFFCSVGLLSMIAGFFVVVGTILYYSKDLPDYTQLKDYKPPVVTRIYSGDGQLMAEYAKERRIFVPVEVIPDIVKHAFISAEDKNFYEHQGVDFFAIASAVISNIKNLGTNKRPRGASTITQQVAKNFLLSNELSYTRKIKEAILAYKMEKALSKDRILELYLNEIYLGKGAYGVAAASLNYFNKSLEELTPAEAAYLAALPKAPNNYNPDKNYDEAVTRRNWVLERMAEDGYITKSQAEMAKSLPLKTYKKDETKLVDAPYFSEEIRKELKEKYGEEGLYGGGLFVKATLNPSLQEIAIKELRKGLMAYDKRHGWRGSITSINKIDDIAFELSKIKKPKAMLPEWKLAAVVKTEKNTAYIILSGGGKGKILLDDTKWARKQLKNRKLGSKPKSTADIFNIGDVIMVSKKEDNLYNLQQIPDVQGAIIAIDPHTGRVLAMQGGWSYKASVFNRATQAKRQPGSAFKPFVYLAALNKGFTPATLVLDAPFVIDQGAGLGKWRPSNYSNEYYGPTPIRKGIEKSKNLMTVRLADFIGMETISEYAAKYGVDEDMEPLLANSLGAGETTLIKLTTAYAMLVNGGKKITPTFIDKIQDRRGKTIFRHDNRKCKKCGPMVKWEGQEVPELPDERQQLDDARTVYQTVSMLEGVVLRGTGIRIKALGRPLAGKTGTTNDSKDAWFIGFSPDLTVGVFVGFDEPISLGRRETGSSVAVPIFRDFMKEALKNSPATPFRIPPGIRNVKINAKTGARAKAGDEEVIWEAFVAGTEPTDKIYILDGKGISVMPAVSGSIEDSATTGTGGLY